MSTVLPALQAGVAFHQSGDFPRAEQMYLQVLRAVPNHPDALHLLGVIAHQVGRHELAVGHIRRAIAANPRVAAYHNNLGSVYQALGQLEEARASYRRALQLDPRLADAHNNLGNVLRDQGRLDEALRRYRRALRIDPRLADAHNNLGVTLRERGRPEEATHSFRRALKLRPRFAEAHNNLGNALKDQGQLDQAVAAYQKALQLQPGYPDALANLAGAYERLNQLDLAAATAAQGLEVAPEHPQLQLVLAKLDHRHGRLTDAMARVEKLRDRVRPETELGREATYLLGRLCDRVGQTDRAFALFTEANRLASRRAGDCQARKQRYQKSLHTLARLFQPDWIASWSRPPEPTDHPPPVFLIGFARTGTTLLDTILGSHPRIQTLEEKPTVHAVHQLIDRMPGGWAKAVPQLTAAQMRKLRDAYFRTADQFLDRDPHRLLLDRNPMNTVMAGLIVRVFPNARFIFAARHPADVCLSCFMQDFQLNDATAHFYRLDDTAALYATVSELWKQYTRVLPVSCHVVRYEDLIEDFEPETRRLLDFLGLDWDDRLYRFADRARHRGMITTPSYDQVTRPIYTHARYRFRRYARQMAPVTDLLEPAMELFGYSSSTEGTETCRSAT